MAGMDTLTMSSTAPPPRQRSPLRDAQRRNRQIREAREAKRLEQTNTLLESCGIPGDWMSLNYYAYLDRYFGFNPSNYGNVGGGVTTINDRRYGQNFPFYLSEVDLQLLRWPARILCGTNAYAIGLMEGWISYIGGDGFTKTVQPLPGKDVPKEVTAKLQGVIDDFAERNEWGGGEQPGLEEELLWRAEEDGEFGLCKWVDDAGCTWVSTFEPEQLTQPPGSDQDYKFGVYVPADSQRAEKYWLRGMNTTAMGEEYDAEQIVHFKKNVKRQMKRGIPTFSFGMNDTLTLSDDLRHSLGVGGKAQAAIAIVRQWQTATGSNLSSMTAAAAAFQLPIPGGGTVPGQLAIPGTTQDIPRDMEYKEGPSGANAPGHVSILQACLRGASARMNAPEWLGSADSSNNSFSSSVIADSLFGRRIIREQKRPAEVIRSVFWWALDERCKRAGEIVVTLNDGSVFRMEWEQLKKLVEVKVTPSSIEVRNKLEEAQRLQILTGASLMSNPQAIVELGGDAAETEEQILEWREKMGAASGVQLPGGDQPGDQPPGMGPEQPPPGGPEPTLPGGTRAGMVAESLLESATPEAVDWLLEAVVNGEGIDKLGRKWSGGKLVPKDKAATTARKSAPVAPNKQHAANVKASEKNVKTLGTAKAKAEKAVAGAEKKKATAGTKHAKQLSAVKAAESSLARAKTPAGKKAAQKRIDAANAKAKATAEGHAKASEAHEAALATHGAVHKAHADASAAHEKLTGQKQAAAVAPTTKAPAGKFGYDPKYEEQKKVIAEWKAKPLAEVEAKSHIAKALAAHKPLKTVAEAKAHLEKEFKIYDARLGDDMEVNNHTIAVLGALKGMGFAVRLGELSTEKFIGMNSNAIGGGGQGRIQMNPSTLISAVKGQAASQAINEQPKWFTTNDPAHFVTHELGHVLHESGGGFKNRDVKEAKFQQMKDKLPDVSTYGKTDYQEFVAEVFAGKVLGREFSKETMDLYKEFGGPVHYQW